MDDLDRAIMLIYDSPSSTTTSPSSVISQALEYCNHLKSGHPPSLLRFCLDRLLSSPLIPVQFWCLQSLHDSLLLSYPSLSTNNSLPLLRSSLLSLFSTTPLPSSSPPFLKNKLAQLLAALIRLDYPSPWPSPFLHLLSHLPSSGSPAADMFARLLLALDDNLISQDYHSSPQDLAAATRVKDAMRLQCVPQIARTCFDIVSLYRSSNPPLAAATLDAISRYIAWIDIALVANDAFLPLLFDLILSPDTPDPLPAASANCILAVVSKRMDPHLKLNLLRSLRVGRVLGNSDLVEKIPALVIGYASEALDCCKKLGSDNSEGSSAMDLLEEALPSVFYVMQTCRELDSCDVVQFLSDYISTMKVPSQKQMVYIGQMLEVIRAQICYDSCYRFNLDVRDKIGKEQEDQMAEHRRDLLVLFRSVCRVAPDVTQLFIRNLLANALSSSSSDMNMEEVEAALTLFHRLGETVSEDGMKTGSGLLKEMVPMLLSAKFSCHSHRSVALVYLEAVTRYLKFVQENGQYLPNALAAFLDERGIHHPNLNVSRRASYLFMRAVKLLKLKLVPFVKTILQSLEDSLVQYTVSDWTSKDLIKGPGFEDGSHAFEAIGLLIGVEEIPAEKQSEYLAALLTPLCQQVEMLLMDAKAHKLDESSPKVLSSQQIIVALIALSKGFSERTLTTTRPAIGLMFKQTLDVLLQILIAFPRIKPLRNKVTSYLHRMVEILGTMVLPYLPIALNQLLEDSEPKDMVDFLVLINQVICKFGASLESTLEELFPTIASRLFLILSSEAFPSGQGSNTEEIRELQELHRISFAFIHVMVTHDLSSVFLAPNSRGYLDAIMQLLLLTSCAHKDVLVRKICVQTFVKLIKDWCSKDNDEDKVPGFRSFVIQNFAYGCCLKSVLDKSFEFRDANTLVLFGEIVLAQKVMYEKLGDDFISYFIHNSLQTAHCPQDSAEQYYHHLKGNDNKSFKSFYQSLIENLRQQENGSLVFR